MKQNAEPLLALENLEVAYGGIRAVRDINLVVYPGEVVCLIGANGAGKSSALRAICGLVTSTAGEIRYQGVSTRGLKPYELVRAGLVMVPEGRGIFGQLTIEENLDMGAYVRRDTAGIRADIAQIYDRFPRLAERRKQAAGTLSGGEQQLVALGRAILARPKLLLLDEPSMGLAPLMVEQVFSVIRAIAQDYAITILLVEQNAHLALANSPRGYVMESGEIILTGQSQDLLKDAKVREAYLGEMAST